MSLVYSLLTHWTLLFLEILRIKPRVPCIPNKSLITVSLSAFFSVLRKARNCPARVDLELTVLLWGLIWGKAWFIQISSTHFDEFLVSSQLRFTLSSDFGQDWFLSPQEVHSSEFSRAYSFFCPGQPLWVLPSLISIFSLDFLQTLTP